MAIDQREPRGRMVESAGIRASAGLLECRLGVTAGAVLLEHSAMWIGVASRAHVRSRLHQCGRLHVTRHTLHRGVRTTQRKRGA